MQKSVNIFEKTSNEIVFYRIYSIVERVKALMKE